MRAIIMAGGSGTRFWPLSRKNRPKQLLDLFGDQSMLTETVERLAPLVRPEDIVVVTGAHLTEATRAAVPTLPPQNILSEPVGRNTAPCIGLATHLLALRDEGDPVIGVFSADHHIGQPEAFLKAVAIAAEAASEPGTIVTLGISPTRPETGYGYIRFTPGDAPALDVDRFVEKPDRPTAEAYLASDDHLWNAGLFFFRASTMLGEIARQLPDMATDLSAIAKDLDTDRADDTLNRLFPTLQSISIDHGIMEGAASMKVVPVDADWSDVGHWGALPLSKDGQGNIVRGDVLAIDTHQSVLWNDRPDHLVALVGVSDLVVVTTHDATLILPRERAQDVRAIVAALKEAKRSDAL